MSRTRWLAGLIGSCALASVASAQEVWPSRRVTVIVPFGAGSSSDVLARYLADKFREALRQPFIIENRAGAGSTLGANIVAKAAPDGYTLLVGGSSTHSSAPALFKSLPYSPMQDFTAIVRVGRWASVVTTNAKQSYRTIADMVAFARSAPGKITYGHGNSTGQMVIEAIKKRMGIDIVRVPYTSTPTAMTDLLNNTIQLLVADASLIPQYEEKGELIALAGFQKSRSALLPKVPTLDETIMSGFEFVPWAGVFGPSKLPGTIVKQIEAVTAALLAQPDARAKLAPLSAEPWFAGSAELSKYIEADIPRWSAAAKDAGIEPQ